MYLIHLRDGVNDEAVFNLTKAIEERDEIRYQLKEKIVEYDKLKNKLEKHKPKFEEINDEFFFFLGFCYNSRCNCIREHDYERVIR